MAKEQEKLKDYTLYQYRLLSRTKLHLAFVVLFLVLYGAGISFTFNQSTSISFQHLLLSIVLPYVFFLLITAIYCRFQGVELKMQLSLYTLWHGLFVPKPMLTFNFFRYLELSILSLSLLLIAGLYVWLPSSIWVLITYHLSIVIITRFYLMSRLLFFNANSFIRYESNGVAQYLTDGK